MITTSRSPMRYLSLVLFCVSLSPVRAEAPPNYPPPAQVKEAFLKLLDRPKVDPAVKSDSPKKLQDGFILEHLTFASEKKADGTFERVPMLILKPENAKGKLPAVIVL